MQLGIGEGRVRHSVKYLFMILDQDLNDNVLKFDIHDGCYCFFLRPQQGGSKHNSKVCHCHQILLVVVSDICQVVHEQL